jgi:hypothetical protein
MSIIYELLLWVMAGIGTIVILFVVYTVISDLVQDYILEVVEDSSCNNRCDSVRANLQSKNDKLLNRIIALEGKKSCSDCVSMESLSLAIARMSEQIEKKFAKVDQFAELKGKLERMDYRLTERVNSLCELPSIKKAIAKEAKKSSMYDDIEYK